MAEDPSAQPSVSAARRSVAKRVGCVAIVAAAAMALGLIAKHGLQTNGVFLRPTTIRTANVADQQEECIYRAIRSKLPKGATVYINDPVHVQRLTELSTLWAVPQSSPATAQWTISLVSVFSLAPGSPADRHCYGLALEVQRR